MDSIISIFDPKIVLDEITIADVEEGSDPNYKPDGTETKLSKMSGSLSPFIVINGMRFVFNQIEYLEIDITGFLPKIIFSFREKAGMFASNSFPKDGDVVSVYIKSDMTDFKPIRQDYRILDVNAAPSLDIKGETRTYVISGILNLPDIFVDKISSFANMSSFDTLQEIAKELKLGFATNEEATNDSMTRICPYVSYEDFIQNDVVSGAYKDDNSFYTCFIDQYYYLNFIEVNSMLVHDRDLDQIRVNNLLSSDYHPDEESGIVAPEKDLYLSNSKLMAGTPNWVTGYTPINNSGIISMSNGYRTYLQYYDKDVGDFEQYFLETLNSDKSDDKIILKGRVNEDHTQQIKTVRFGYQFNDNVHRNFLHAKLQNKYNNTELKKLQVVANLGGVNPLIIRNQIVPLIIIGGGGNDVRRVSTRSNDTKGEDDIVLDKFITGFYTVMGIKFFYGKVFGDFKTQVVLGRREYEIPTKD